MRKSDWKQRCSVAYLLIAAIIIDCAFARSKDGPLRLKQPARQEMFEGDNIAGHGVRKRNVPGFLRTHSVPPGEIVVAVNEYLELRCEVSGSPPASIHWLKNGEPITEVLLDLEENTNRIDESIALGSSGIASTSSVLKIDCADFDTEAIYTCVAESFADRLISSTYVHVEGISPFNATVCKNKHEFSNAGAREAQISMWFATFIETQGKDAVLACRAIGNPRPRIFWLNGEGHVITNSQKYQVLPNGDLKIRSLSWEDMGGYTCVAENKHGRDENYTFLYPLRPES